MRDITGLRILAGKPTLIAATIVATLVVTGLGVAGCTSIRERLKGMPTNPELAARMRSIDRTGVALARSIDDGDLTGVDDMVKVLVQELQSVRSIAPVPVEDGQEPDMYAYYSALDAAVEHLADIRVALGSNRWDMVGARYDRLRKTCIACHRTHAAGTVRLQMPKTRNF